MSFNPRYFFRWPVPIFAVPIGRAALVNTIENNGTIPRPINRISASYRGSAGRRRVTRKLSYQLSVDNLLRWQNYQILLYVLPMIIAVGYRVRFSRSTQFCHWAICTLGKYLQRGFVLDYERLKNQPVGIIVAAKLLYQ